MTHAARQLIESLHTLERRHTSKRRASSGNSRPTTDNNNSVCGRGTVRRLQGNGGRKAAENCGGQMSADTELRGDTRDARCAYLQVLSDRQHHRAARLHHRATGLAAPRRNAARRAARRWSAECSPHWHRSAGGVANYALSIPARVSAVSESRRGRPRDGRVRGHVLLAHRRGDPGNVRDRVGWGGGHPPAVKRTQGKYGRVFGGSSTLL